MSKSKVFVLNNETVKNSYGFYVKTSGIGLQRFKDNPVCLKDHSNSTKDVLGKWTNIMTSGALLTATPEFDTKDADGSEVVRKVENGTIKGCSLGIMFDKKNLKLIDKKLVVIACELTEVSIVAVPSNASTIALFDKKGERINEAEVKEMCLSLTNKVKETKINNMKTITTHLQLQEDANEVAVLTAIKETENKLSAALKEKLELEVKLKEINEAEITALKAEFDQEICVALKDGRIDEKSKKTFVALADSNSAEALKILKTLPKRESVKSSLKTGEAKVSDFNKMSWDELDKGNHLANLKENEKEYYDERFKKQFGK